MNKDVNEIIEIIKKNNGDGFLVGGAVRDMVLNKEPHDYDIATNLSYDELERIFPKNFASGKAFGIITIFYNGEQYEIAHFRNDGDYADNRHCDVKLVETVDEDLARRDFTINAMAWNEKDGLIDLFGGKEDIGNKLIRAVGNPDERFKEDGLRMLRAIRFSAQLGFDIEENTYKAIVDNAHLIKNISFERIETELSKILVSDHPEKIEELYNTGISKYIFPELDAIMKCPQNSLYHIYSVGKHTIEAVKNVKNDRNLRWTMLLHDIGKPVTKTVGKDGYDHFAGHASVSKKMASDILTRFKFSNADKEEIERLVLWHDVRMTKINHIRKNVAIFGVDFFDKLLTVQFADIDAQSKYKKDEKIENILALNEKVHEVFNDKSAITIADLKINGNDLIEFGFKGKEIGAVLEELLEICLNEPGFNNRERLLLKVKSLKEKTLDELIEKHKQKKQKHSNKEIDEER